ncbi:MAG: DUF434 domain-containing protein [Bacteroidia bacterium]
MSNRNRGKQPNDDKVFAPKWIPILTEAVNDLSFLLSRGYASNSAMQLVGNRYKLNKRQRVAVYRVSASEQEVAGRKASQCQQDELKAATVDIDGFNLLILLESAISGAYIFKGRDGTLRDISSVHGSYKRVRQTEEAIRLTGRVLQDLQVASVNWYLDKPISNSGRLLSRLYEIAEEEGFNWRVELVYSPDKVLAMSSNIVVSSDGWVLDQAECWFNLGALLVEECVEHATVVEL